MQLFGFLKSVFTNEVSQSQPKKEKWVVFDVPSYPGSTLNAYKESDIEGMKEKQNKVSDDFDRAKAYQQQQKEQDFKSEHPTTEYKNTPFQ